MNFDRPRQAVGSRGALGDRERPTVTGSFVVDASVAVGWVHPAQATAQTAAMLDAIAEGATLEVPALWPLEVASALVVLVRRRKLTENERQIGLGWLRGLPLRMEHEMASLAFSRLSELASAHQLSIYDAAYLDLAQRRKLALGCKDGPLRKAARRTGVNLWE
jgi:predicted nucleic acid-binding protein